jgi:hypothetical protein
MGSQQFSGATYRSARTHLVDSGKSFTRQATAQQTGNFSASAIADGLNPRKLNRAIHPQGARECCKVAGVSDVMPIAIFMDLTGSMGQFPYEIQKDLPTIMQTLIDRGITEHPSIMVGGMDDEFAVRPDACFQLGQFESGSKELLDAVNNIIIPHNGGGNSGESYHLAFYAMARHTYSQPFAEDGQKGVMFLIGDEEPCIFDADPAISGTTPEIAKEVFGDDNEAVVTMLESVRQVAKQYNIFIIRPDRSSSGSVTKKWQKLLESAGENPENVIDSLQTTAEVIATMVLLIGQKFNHNVDELADVLRSQGANIASATLNAVRAIVPVGDNNNKALAVKGVATGELVTAGDGRTRR